MVVGGVSFISRQGEPLAHTEEETMANAIEASNCPYRGITDHGYAVVNTSGPDRGTPVCMGWYDNVDDAHAFAAQQRRIWNGTGAVVVNPAVIPYTRTRTVDHRIDGRPIYRTVLAPAR